MQPITFLVLAALVAVAYAEGQYYVPRAYYIIDSQGHESPPIPLRRLRRQIYDNFDGGYNGGGGGSWPGSDTDSWSNSESGSSSWSNSNSGSNSDGWYRPGGFGAVGPQ